MANLWLVMGGRGWLWMVVAGGDWSHDLVMHIIKKLIKLFYLDCSCKKVVEKANKKNLKVIKNTLPWKALRLICT